MKILYYGGQKSGKSLLAEQKALSLAGDKTPFYIATYDNSYGDTEMQTRVSRHQKQRRDQFHTIEETHHLAEAVSENGTCLIDCISMWILNTLTWEEAQLFTELERIISKKANIIFVLNDITSGVIPIDATSRTYVDRSGIIGQQLAAICDEVYEVKLGIPIKLK